MVYHVVNGVTMIYVLKPTASNLRTKTCEEDNLEQMCADCNSEVGLWFSNFSCADRLGIDVNLNPQKTIPTDGK